MNIATVGTFDGVHRGHIAVVDALLKESHSRGLAPMIITFTNHPLEVVAPERAPKMLMPASEKKRALEEKGVEVTMLTFDKALCALTAKEWLDRLHNQFGVEVLILGYDNTFGSDGRHISREDYHRLGQQAGIEIIDAPVIPGCSSSAVRKAVANGEVEKASEILGRPYSIDGRVVHGKALGRTIGFPTANIESEPRILLPANGVYAAQVEGIEGQSSLMGVVNIGTRPTVNGSQVSVECHLPGWEGNLYDRRIKLAFLRRLREERRFGSLEELKQAIANDVAQVTKESENQKLLHS